MHVAIYVAVAENGVIGRPIKGATLIGDGATAPTPHPGDTGGHGCSVVWPLGVLLLAPLLFVGPRR